MDFSSFIASSVLWACDLIDHYYLIAQIILERSDLSEYDCDPHISEIYLYAV